MREAAAHVSLHVLQCVFWTQYLHSFFLPVVWTDAGWKTGLRQVSGDGSVCFCVIVCVCVCVYVCVCVGGECSSPMKNTQSMKIERNPMRDPAVLYSACAHRHRGAHRQTEMHTDLQQGHCRCQSVG